MLMADAIFIVLLLAPLAVTYFLKSNAAIGFLSLTAGMALSTYAASDVQGLVNHLGFWASLDNINLALTVAPLVLSLLFVRGSSSGLSKYLHLAAALCTGYLLGLTLLPILNGIGTITIANSSAWQNIQKVQSYIVGVGVILSLLLAWMPHGKHSKKH